MSYDRSSPPLAGGGWSRSSPGLTSPGSGTSTPHSGIFSPPPLGPSGISWATAKAKSDEVRGYPSFSTRNNGFFSRQKRKISARIPRFRTNSSYAEYNGDKDVYGLGVDTWSSGWYGRSRHASPLFCRSVFRRKRFRVLLGMVLGWISYFLFWTGELDCVVLLCYIRWKRLTYRSWSSAAIVESYRRSSWGGGRKFVVILASNVEGGVMEWKGAREWAIERNSVWNKQEYTKRWGYELEVVNMLAKKRYSYEWRESWEKVDVIRETMLKYPDAEWWVSFKKRSPMLLSADLYRFWWLDLNTWIMEHSYSLQDHIFDHLSSVTYRDINVYNPLNITHPFSDTYLDELDRSPTGDQDPSSIQIVLSQDCAGFNLGSFFIRRSIWSDRLLDALWDPVLYEQKHMNWEHKEQDALEHLYATQPWVRSGVAFLPQRHINSFPPGACGDEIDKDIHYSERDRDFVVNMAGCQFGRDCWGEMNTYRERSNWLNRTRWQRFKDGLGALFGRSSEKSKEQQAEEHR